MEPTNRPYVDPDIEPGDEGTEEWADTAPDDTGEGGQRGPLAAGGAKTDAEGVLEGSPADEFDDGDAITGPDRDPA